MLILLQIYRHSTRLLFTFFVMAEPEESTSSYSDEELGNTDKPAADSVRGWSSKSTEAAQKRVAAKAPGSHGKTYVWKQSDATRSHQEPRRIKRFPDALERGQSRGKASRSFSSHRVISCEYPERGPALRTKNVGVQRAARAVRDAGNSNNAYAQNPRGQRAQHVHASDSDSDITTEPTVERIRTDAHERVRKHSRSAETALCKRGVDTRNRRVRREETPGPCHDGDAIDNILTLFAPGWFPSVLYTILHGSFEDYRPSLSPVNLGAIHSFKEAFLYIDTDRNTIWNTYLKDSLSQLRQTRRRFADEYAKLSTDVTSDVIRQFSLDFLLSPHENRFPPRKKNSVANHIMNKEMGCQFRIRALVKLGLWHFRGSHDKSGVARALVKYITDVEDLARTIKLHDELQEDVHESPSLQARPKLMKTQPKRRARQWRCNSNPAKDVKRARHCAGFDASYDEPDEFSEDRSV